MPDGRIGAICVILAESVGSPRTISSPRDAAFAIVLLRHRRRNHRPRPRIVAINPGESDIAPARAAEAEGCRGGTALGSTHIGGGGSAVAHATALVPVWC